jgi:hypothetical protein
MAERKKSKKREAKLSVKLSLNLLFDFSIFKLYSNALIRPGQVSRRLKVLYYSQPCQLEFLSGPGRESVTNRVFGMCLKRINPDYGR